MTQREKALQKAILEQAHDEFQEALDHLNYADDEHFDKACDKYLKACTHYDYDLALVKSNFGCHITRGKSSNKKDVEHLKSRTKAIDLILACKEEFTEQDEVIFHRDYGDVRYVVTVKAERKVKTDDTLSI